MDQVKDPNGSGDVSMQRILVEPLADRIDSNADDLNPNGAFWNTIKHELRRAKWVDDATFNLVIKLYPWLGLDRGEIIVAMGNMVGINVQEK